MVLVDTGLVTLNLVYSDGANLINIWIVEHDQLNKKPDIDLANRWNWPGWHVEHDLCKAGGVVGGRLPCIGNQNK